ncbi:MAG TPA: LOG family protein [Pyrinomonadaceae bacterium]|nr:LOG family protein [Pyrinomonadaceae bacterium]HMP64950.1 LOG family protein [Pyrinomonadaceae bacterium]
MIENTEERIVTIFGGSRCGHESQEYKDAEKIGFLLASAGFTICTGGYLGVMEAASRGARDAGGRVFGIVMNQFKSEPNRYLTDKVATNHFYERLQNLITRSVGFVALRGGMGTVTEVSLVWNKLQTGVLERRPLVLVGDCWKEVVDVWRRNLEVSDNDLTLIDFAADADAASQLILERTGGSVI